MPKLQENFNRVSSLQETNCFCKMFTPSFFFGQGKTLKNFSKKLFTSKIKKKGTRGDEK